VLREFAEKQRIPYPLLSDLDSRVIRAFGILNDRIDENDAFLFGIPYPGVYVTDENGVVTAKFFRDSYKKRESPENLLDAALGRIELQADVPRVATGDAEVRITAAVHGGKGTIRQGVMRKLVVRFELAPGLHLYGEPVPQGMIPTTVEVTGPPGLVVEAPVFPPSTPLALPSLGLTLPVWSGTFDVAVPIYAVGELASETRPLDAQATTLEVRVRYQACDDERCLLPKTETLRLVVPLDVIDVPALAMHQGHGQREANFDGTPHLRRMLLRAIRRSPFGMLRFAAKSIRLELAARRRRALYSRSASSSQETPGRNA
jgi:hypothetical protein